MLHKHLPLLLLSLISFTYGVAQQETIPVTNSTTEQQLENIAEANEAETEDDSYLQQYQQFRRHPLNLNTAEEADFKAFLFLSPLQIQQFLSYRNVLGKLISIYELQAVPGWNVETIRRIQPYIYVGSAVSLKEGLRQRLTQGNHVLLGRYTQILEQQKGFIKNDSGTSAYLGSPQRLVFRYKYQYKNLLQYGITADKDAGEMFFKGKGNRGFDFYSLHLFARNMGSIKYLALGDFTVNMGQGLVNWQALAFRKSADVMSIKRQADILRPYNSPGEFNFFRGAGISLQKGYWQTTGFISYKKVSANGVADSMSVDPIISSLQSSGYHRTASELEDKNRIGQFSFGGNIGYKKGALSIGLNTVHHQLSASLQKQDQPYNLFALTGRTYTNASIDYSYTWKNLHFFGEAATNAIGKKAFVNGLLASLNTRTDVSFFYRHLDKAYTTLYGSAFTESTVPSNENGLYAGLALRPIQRFTINVYADLFSFPWLRYRVDRPSHGSEYLAQLTWRPNKQTEIYTRWVQQDKAINLSNTLLPMHITSNRVRQNWRTHVSTQLSPEWAVRLRAEVLWFDKQTSALENGFLTYTDFFYKPLNHSFSGNIRLQYFETDSYDSRLYAFENDVLYSFSIPPFFGKGYRWYVNANYDVTRKLTCWFRIAQTYYPDGETVGSGYDLIYKNHRTDVKFQFVYSF